jgi:hypothetical protein
MSARIVPSLDHISENRKIDAAVSSLRDLIDTRLDAMDKAIELLQQIANRSPTIGEVYARFEERFIRIDQAFIERDKRTDQLTVASSTAIAAALQAQKEAAGESQKSSSAAIAKAETATNESLKQLQVLFQTSIGALQTAQNDIKSRIDKGEASGVGHKIAVDDYRYEHKNVREEAGESRALFFGVIGIAIGLSAMIITIFVSVVPHLSH